ncbi:MAG: PAS domain-containing protein [Comamonadaceae bacterium]|nr:MAG: PAS domain-containing protein [Comamonadaceae bacterium]
MISLSMRHQQVAALLESTSDPCFAVDGAGRISAWNGAAQSYFALSAQDAIGSPCHQIVQGADECGAVCSPNCSTMQAMRGKHSVGNFDLMVMTPQGQKWCNVSVLLANRENSSNQLALHIVREVHFRKRIELLMQEFIHDELCLTTEQTLTLARVKRSAIFNTKLSEREIEVLKLIAKGTSTKSVSQQLHISPSTVNNHVQHILRKLNASNRLDAVLRAEHSGLI